MKEKILEIMNKYMSPHPFGAYERDESAKEITSHVMEFIEWLHDNTDDTRVMSNANLWWVNILGEFLSIEKVFQYWLDIKLKT